MKKICFLFLFVLFVTHNLFSIELVGDEKLEHQITCKLLSDEIFLEEIKGYIQKGYAVSDFRYYYTDEKEEYQIQIIFRNKDNLLLCFALYNAKNNSISKLKVCQ